MGLEGSSNIFKTASFCKHCFWQGIQLSFCFSQLLHNFLFSSLRHGEGRESESLELKRERRKGERRRHVSHCLWDNQVLCQYDIFLWITPSPTQKHYSIVFQNYHYTKKKLPSRCAIRTMEFQNFQLYGSHKAWPAIPCSHATTASGERPHSTGLLNSSGKSAWEA